MRLQAPDLVRRVHVLPVEGPHCEKVDSSNMVTTVRALRRSLIPILRTSSRILNFHHDIGIFRMGTLP